MARFAGLPCRMSHKSDRNPSSPVSSQPHRTSRKLRHFVAGAALSVALPSILTGVRYALATAWLALVVAETIGAQSGIGFLAMDAREFLRTDVIVLTIVIYALIGVAADLGQCHANTPIQSAHSGGAQCCFADGSVHFLSETIEIQVLYNLANRDDGQVVRADQF